MHRSKQDEAHMRVDYTGFYISAINYFIRVAFEAQSRLDMETNSAVLKNDVAFRENLQFLIQIQEAFGEWLPDYSTALRGRSDRDGISAEPAFMLTLDESPKPTETAKLVSDLLKNEDLPEALKDGLRDGLIDLFNSHINQNEFVEYENSPEYVDKILRGYANRHK